MTVYAVALVVDLLAPTFGGQRNFPNALRLTVYSYTPVWLAGIFLLVPGASFLAILGLYGFYLLWTRPAGADAGAARQGACPMSSRSRRVRSRSTLRCASR